MRKLVYYVGVSLDGRIAGPGGEFDFFPQGDEQQAAAYSTWVNALYPETVPTAYRAAVGVADAPNRRFDTVVMGLGTYRPAFDNGITSPYAHLRQYVVSSTLKPDTDPAVTVVPRPGRCRNRIPVAISSAVANTTAAMSRRMRSAGSMASP